MNKQLIKSIGEIIKNNKPDCIITISVKFFNLQTARITNIVFSSSKEDYALNEAIIFLTNNAITNISINIEVI